ncbi:Glycosyltransferase Family 2 protein [Glomus cerebriforme]|uniref:chitin synthase n=1 Tax=Glomus cerebriforme TaxID=658196 RepID=A0A397S1T5_9GLOM|nr:Glycosyltransferase Family 2 protein [Glomus cerebriforme]
MDGGYYSNENRPLSALRRGKTLNRPERYQPAAPLLTGAKGTKDNSCDVWVIFSKVVTFWAPASLLSSIGGLPDKQSQQAWREKIALCFIAVIMGGIVAFLTVGFSSILCPPSEANNPSKFKRFGESPGHLGINGWQFDVTNGLSRPGLDFQQLANEQNGQDITVFFQRTNQQFPDCLKTDIQKFNAVSFEECGDNACPLKDVFIKQSTFDLLNIVNTSTRVGYDWPQIGKLQNYLVISGNVLNLDPYINKFPNPIPDDELDKTIRTVLGTDHLEGGKDGTALFFGRPDTKAAVNCMVEKFYAGNIDKDTIGCFISKIFLLVSLTVILGVVLTRFAMACIFNWFISHRLATPPKENNNVPAVSQVVSGDSPYAKNGGISKIMTMNDVGNNLYTVLLVTCYSEDEAGLRCTCESMAATDYPNDRKMLFLICDGIITGSGNDKSTPDICISLMEISPEFKDPQPMSYVAIADGAKRHNMAKVYAGYFPWKDEQVPMICVVKCGTPEEQGKPKPGNRGKRDSQLILMNFFSRITYNDRMSPLDYDLFRKTHHLMGVTPDFFEIVLMVDADTKVYPDSLKLLINCMCNDPLIMGLCGETRIANKRDSWVTAIQVFEYYISHHLGKGFESVFGGVTCLPGCFCMYRLKARKGEEDWVPIITKPEIVQEYSQNVVTTLHQKNLLLLGEDRFLTTLMLRNFPYRKMMFCPQAICKTVVPDDFNVLLSQRRRWINSTIHNLMELVLVRNLCGTFCFSMQFVIFMELIGTVVLPVAILLTYALIVSEILNPPKDFTSAIPLLMLVMVLGLPGILILITTRKLVYIAWMVIYLLFLPVWNFILPAYAYWHFDDFSWGETRKVEGEAKGDDHGKKEGQFDPSKITFKRWEDWERGRIRSKKRQEKQKQIQYKNVPSSHADDYYETASNISSSDVGNGGQYYNYDNSQPQQYNPYQQQYNQNGAPQDEDYFYPEQGGGYDQEQYNQGQQYNQRQYGQEQYDQGPYDQRPYNQGQYPPYNQGQYDQGYYQGPYNRERN